LWVAELMVELEAVLPLAEASRRVVAELPLVAERRSKYSISSLELFYRSLDILFWFHLDLTRLCRLLA